MSEPRAFFYEHRFPWTRPWPYDSGFSLGLGYLRICANFGHYDPIRNIRIWGLRFLWDPDLEAIEGCSVYRHEREFVWKAESLLDREERSDTIVSRVYKLNPDVCCERCVFGRGEHAEWCWPCPTCQSRIVLDSKGNGTCPECGTKVRANEDRKKAKAILDFFAALHAPGGWLGPEEPPEEPEKATPANQEL